MTTTTEKRQWLLDNGHDVSLKGRLSREQLVAYDEAHPDDPIVIPDDDGDPDLPDDPFDESAPVAEIVPETRPQRPHAPRGKGKGKSLLGGLLSGSKPAGKPRTGKKPPRVSLDKFLGRIYTRGGQMVSAFAPATGRCLQAQSAMAGIILEDVARDTVVDRFLQPVARAEEKLDKVFALVAPPALVFALETTDPENMVRRAMLTGILRESLLISMDVTSMYAERVAANAQRTAENEAAVDKLLQFIFAPPEQASAPEPEMAAA